MPLINLKTNLTSLKYGGDRPGGGNSGQPYMQFPIENANTPTAIKRYYEANRTSLDFPIRGGGITQLITGEFGALTSTVDRERIQKFFNDAPRGKAFIEKQVGLQLTNPRTQVPNALAFAGPALKNSVLPVTNVYNPLNTLTQVQVMGTGLHFNRHGAFPTITEINQQTYQYIAGAPQNNTSVTNRLAILKTLKLDGTSNFLLNPTAANALGLDSLLTDRMGISPIQNQLFNYPGGPGSVYGIGNTRIFRYTNTAATDLLANRTQGFTVGGDPTPTGVARPYSAISLTYAQLSAQNTRETNPESPTQAKIQDFRQQTNNGNPIISNQDYTVYNIANPFDGVGGLGIGNPGAPLVESSFLISKAGGSDALNKLNPFYYQATKVDPWTAGGNDTKDIIRFTFECISNSNPDYAIALMFRAFFDGQISDSNTGEYNAFKYLGRGETFRTYQGFDRTISFSFKVAAQSRDEMKPLYTKLNQLISQVYPDYSPTYNLMRGSVVRLTIGDYIYRMPGFLENVNVTIDNSNTPWEIQLLGPEAESDVAQLPHMVTVSCTFKPIMDVLPQRNTLETDQVALIGNVKNNTFLNGTRDVTPTQPVTITQNLIPSSNVNDLGVSPAKLDALSARGNQQIKTITQAQQVASNKNAKAKQAATKKKPSTAATPQKSTSMLAVNNVNNTTLPTFKPF